MSEQTAQAESLTPEQQFLNVIEGRREETSVAAEDASEEVSETEEATEEAQPEEAEQAEPSDEAEEVAADSAEEEPVEDAVTYRLPMGENGEDIEVDAGEIKNFVLRQADYTKKTQQLAEQRKQLAEERNSIRAVQKLADDLQKQFQAARKTNDLEPSKEYWDQLKLNNPTQYLIERQEFQERRQERAVNERKLLHLRNQMEQQRHLEYQEQLNNEQQRLMTMIPEWAESEELATKEKAALRLYGVEQGYSENELEEVVDSRAISILRKSYLWDQLQAKRGSLKKKALEMPASSGSAQQIGQPRKHSELTKAKQRLAQTNKRTDAAAAFQQLLDRR